MRRLYEEMERQIEEEKELVIQMVGIRNKKKNNGGWPSDCCHLGTWDRVMPTLFLMTQERAKELQLRNEMRDEIAKKDQLLAQLQSREKELQEALCRAQENEAASKHDLALLAKEKVYTL